MVAKGDMILHRARRRARFTLIALFLLFFGPVLGALVLHVAKPAWHPFGTVNKGQLLTPLVRLPANGLSPLDGGGPLTELIGTSWTLLHVSESCAAACEAALIRIRQARLALGKDADRVERLYLVARSPGLQALGETLAQHPGLRIATVDSMARSALPAGRMDGDVLLVDPSGFLVLRYTSDQDATALLKDLKRLLKISKDS